MRNKTLTLKKLVPKRIRKTVYDQALQYYEDCLGEPSRKYLTAFGESTPLGLCLLLPCILWDLDTYMDRTPINGTWVHRDTPIAFPEIKSYLDEIADETDKTERVKLRIEILKEIISKLK